MTARRSGLVRRLLMPASAMRKTMFCSCSLFGFLFGFAAACDTQASNSCQTGSEGCLCTKDYECLTGLVCLSEYCVDPDWDPGDEGDEGDEGDSDDDDSGDEDDSGDDDSGATAPDNVGACEGWIESAECGDYDWSQSIDCGAYASHPCDVADYFNCLNDNTGCTNGIPDTTGWAECAELATCA